MRKKRFSQTSMLCHPPEKNNSKTLARNGFHSRAFVVAALVPGVRPRRAPYSDRCRRCPPYQVTTSSLAPASPNPISLPRRIKSMHKGRCGDLLHEWWYNQEIRSPICLLSLHGRPAGKRKPITYARPNLKWGGSKVQYTDSINKIDLPF